MEDLLTVLEALKLETIKPTTRARKLSFSAEPLTPAELATSYEAVCVGCGATVTEYQYRALAVIKDSFYEKAVKKYPPEHHSIDTCILVAPEYRPMFNEIHRATAYFVSKGLSVHDGLVVFLKGLAARK